MDPVFRAKPHRSQERDRRDPVVIEADNRLRDAQEAYRLEVESIDKALRRADLDADGNGPGTAASARDANDVRKRFWRFQ